VITARRRSAYTVSVVSVLALCGCWQLASLVFTSRGLGGAPLVAGWQWLIGKALPQLSNYGGGGNGLAVGHGGGGGTYSGAFTVIVDASWATLKRLLAGFALGAAAGIGLALATSWSAWGRRVVGAPAQLIRMIPLLALIPLFQQWFGISFKGVVLFVAFGVGAVFFAAAVTAVRNVPPVLLRNARMLGASRARVYRTVVLPAIVPQMRSALFLSIGVAWTATLGAELLGVQSGLGFIIAQAQQFSRLDRIAVIGLVFAVWALLSLAAADLVTRRLVRWQPSRAR
jgi:sulfonate transport system permease protein